MSSAVATISQFGVPTACALGAVVSGVLCRDALIKVLEIFSNSVGSFEEAMISSMEFSRDQMAVTMTQNPTLSRQPFDSIQTDIQNLKKRVDAEKAYIKNNYLKVVTLLIIASLGTMLAMGAFAFSAYLVGKAVVLGTVIPSVGSYAAVGGASFAVGAVAKIIYETVIDKLG